MMFSREVKRCYKPDNIKNKDIGNKEGLDIFNLKRGLKDYKLLWT